MTKIIIPDCSTGKTVTRDLTSEEQKDLDAQKTYRQSLRDITKTYKSMDDADFSWPTKPS